MEMDEERKARLEKMVATAQLMLALIKGVVNVLEKWFPLLGERAHSLYFWSLKKNNKIERQNNNNRPINLPNVITFSTDYRYTT